MKYIITQELVDTIAHILIGQGRHGLYSQLRSLKPIEPRTEDGIEPVQSNVCPNCKGAGTVLVASFVDSRNQVSRSCSICKGCGMLASPAVELPIVAHPDEFTCPYCFDGTQSYSVSGVELPVVAVSESWPDDRQPMGLIRRVPWSELPEGTELVRLSDAQAAIAAQGAKK